MIVICIINCLILEIRFIKISYCKYKAFVMSIDITQNNYTL